MSNELVACGHEAPIFVLAKRNAIIQKLIAAIEPHKDEFDAIAMSGYSMSMIAPILCHHFQKNIIIVRKEAGHGFQASGYRTEGMKNQRYIIVDDFIFSGNTFTRIIDNCYMDLDCELVAYCFYGTSNSKIDEVIEWTDNPNVKCWYAQQHYA